MNRKCLLALPRMLEEVDRQIGVSVVAEQIPISFSKRNDLDRANVPLAEKNGACHHIPLADILL